MPKNLAIITFLLIGLTACSATQTILPAAITLQVLDDQHILDVQANAEACLNNTTDEGQCKDCCDSLDTSGIERKSCRDSCAVQDFSQNTKILSFEAVSVLGPQGDYSVCTVSSDERTCKDCCDDSADITGGDRRFCRDACAGSVGVQVGENPAPPSGQEQPPQEQGQGPREMTIEQAISDEAQRNTIAFDALAFLTGDLGADSFFPPGKVADFWGFQYLRDNDPSEMGHNTDFLTKAAFNMLTVLTPEQRAELVTLAQGQVDDINEYGYMRFTLMDAFRRLLAGDLPTGTTSLDEEAVKAYSAELYRLDGEISYERAQVMGGMLNSLDETQRAYLDALVGVGMLDWPDVEEPSDVRGLERDVKVAVMTYAGDMFSWYLGSIEADVYFCPERQGTYFGSFYMKDAPAVGNPGYNIGTNITADYGIYLLETLSPEQSALITTLVDIQRPYLLDIVETRKEIAAQLRRFMSGDSAGQSEILALMKTYGELDGAIVHNFAVNFAQVSQTLSDEQLAQLMALREELLGELIFPNGAYLYSQSIPTPEIPNTDFLFR